jgi:FkbM family methyltransferase
MSEIKTYVQIGSNEGKDDFFRKMSKLSEPSKIVLVEPNSYLIDKLKRCYEPLSKKHTVVIFNNAIIHDTSIDTLVLYGEDSGLSSIIVRKSHPYNTDIIKFEGITFDQMCNRAGINEIEELQIDTEGYDYTILNSIDFSSIKIMNINCEVWPYDQDSTSTIKTGPKYFEDVIRPKIEKIYKLSSSVIDGMNTHIFTRLNLG